jgi:hypothetical protein
MVSLEQGQGPNCGAPAVPSAFMKRPKIGYWPESGRFVVQVTSARPSGSAITLVSDSLPGISVLTTKSGVTGAPFASRMRLRTSYEHSAFNGCAVALTP